MIYSWRKRARRWKGWKESMLIAGSKTSDDFVSNCRCLNSDGSRRIAKHISIYCQGVKEYIVSRSLESSVELYRVTAQNSKRICDTWTKISPNLRIGKVRCDLMMIQKITCHNGLSRMFWFPGLQNMLTTILYFCNKINIRENENPFFFIPFHWKKVIPLSWATSENVHVTSFRYCS